MGQNSIQIFVVNGSKLGAIQHPRLPCQEISSCLLRKASEISPKLHDIDQSNGLFALRLRVFEAQFEGFLENPIALGPVRGKTILGDRDLPKTRMRVQLKVSNVLQNIKQSTLINILFFCSEFSHSLGQ